MPEGPFESDALKGASSEAAREMKPFIEAVMELRKMPDPLVWRAVCGVDGSRWIAAMHDDSNPPPGGTFCPDCQARGLMAPGVLNWRSDPNEEARNA